MHKNNSTFGCFLLNLASQNGDQLQSDITHFMLKSLYELCGHGTFFALC